MFTCPTDWLKELVRNQSIFSLQREKTDLETFWFQCSLVSIECLATRFLLLTKMPNNNLLVAPNPQNITGRLLQYASCLQCWTCVRKFIDEIPYTLWQLSQYQRMWTQHHHYCNFFNNQIYFCVKSVRIGGV